MAFDVTDGCGYGDELPPRKSRRTQIEDRERGRRKAFTAKLEKLAEPTLEEAIARVGRPKAGENPYEVYLPGKFGNVMTEKLLKDKMLADFRLLAYGFLSDRETCNATDTTRVPGEAVPCSGTGDSRDTADQGPGEGEGQGGG